MTMSEDSFYVWYGSCVICYNKSHLWFYINKELDPWEWALEEPAQSSNALENASKKDIVESMDN